MYEPLAAVLAQQFVVWGLDFPGHGSAVNAKLHEGPSGSSSSSSSSSHCGTCNAPNSIGGGGGSTMPISPQGVTQYVITTIQQAGLQGCYAFGHSAGGAFALLAASQCPQLFTAIYCFEAVLAAPASHAFMAEASASGAITTDGQLLGSLARKRRATFSSRWDALQHLTAKPPFSRMHPQVVALYVQHGLVEVGGSVVAGPRQQNGPVLCTGQYQQQQLQQRVSSEQVQTCQLQQAPTQQGARQAAGDSLAQQQQQQAVRLLCPPEQEAAYFEALHPPPSLDPGSVSCPVLLAVAAPAQGGSSSTPAEALVTHEAVAAWFYKHSQGSSRRQLHGALRVLNCELAAAMPTARLLEFEGVSHFGPLEDPLLLADSCAKFFNSCDPVPQQQQQTSSKL